ncbi:MAG: 50S ribosomal protein L19 [Candidatus Yanofskybacteria bacterium RIFCSPHIGHO2_02_FULL_44_12b]|uniref:50S ribosomal protein L19 n=2 Tax=Candidatus Yanofskyibacteriota TaxID=1752733 RepID=A0A1F8GMV7_9BACT|nr:MAG: 50S ribosomal protein L19 [Candidatus Yanofskybacteria bacterium GW2011_GWA2_44_9]OGN05006.1 MAG: 50S ribosomal protein L19 [Candidatus Yanofskybacteria bacterium RIFCSPHIGHO2_01_FULL_44_24]OGN13958.1 MAG: 50S ribosomal protein L19 [Candidatus Yanofskybacteria bacterium RIFCSPHIGHO2_02_FULL_44_12b]OGN26320.1 MAG: 50S ribosomal protein L19 [Candidatus Yanofskybacteria bacterium RIFCSPLOWO2_01_FULL_44_22]
MNNLLFPSKSASESKLKDLRPGWTVKIHQKIKDGDKTRTQAFEGTVIARKHGNEAGGTITVRKVSGGIGVEKIFPIHLPSIERVAVLKKTTGRRSKLYYLRDKSAKEIRRKIGQESVVSQAE